VVSIQAIQDVQRSAAISEDNQFTIERLIRNRVRRVGRGKRVQYLVKWKGHPGEENTWEAEVGIHDALIKDFELRSVSAP
jgi:hypothetical protein